MKGATKCMKITLIIFLEKSSAWASAPFWVQKLCTVVTLDMLKGFVVKFRTVKEAKRYIKIVSVFFFGKKYLSGQFGHFGPKNDVLITLDSLPCFFKNLHSVSGAKVHEDHFNDFSEKILFGRPVHHFGPKNDGLL